MKTTKHDPMLLQLVPSPDVNFVATVSLKYGTL